MARILLFDLETSPNLGYTWGKWETNVIAFTQESYLLCYAYKWYEETNTKVVALPDFDSYKKDKTNDKELVQKLHQLFNEADVIIAHNGDKFDIKYANGRFLYHGLEPPTAYKTVDTLKIARSKFKLNSNKLDDLGKLLNVGKKVETGGFDLWLGCMAGDEKSWYRMKKYNKQDVELLEQVYLRLRAWVTNHPNLNIINGTTLQCPTCQSEKLWKIGIQSGKQRYRCQECRANVYGNLQENKVLKS
jgi:DNA polymerase elongation subunit (family B)